MKELLRVGLVRPHAGTGSGFFPGVMHVIDQRAGQCLLHGPRHHGGEYPVERFRLRIADLIHGQPVDHGEAHAVVKRGLHALHERATGGKRELRGIYLFGGTRMQAQFGDDFAQFGKTFGGQREKPVFAFDVGAHPRLLAGDDMIDDRHRSALVRHA